MFTALLRQALRGRARVKVDGQKGLKVNGHEIQNWIIRRVKTELFLRQTVHFRAAVHFKDRRLSAFRTVHFRPDLLCSGDRNTIDRSGITRYR